MKKIIVLLAVLFGVSFVANAQQGVCKVSNANGASVVVNVLDWNEDGTVNLEISSDCNSYVNVSFTLSYCTYTPTAVSASQTSQIFNVLAAPNACTPKRVQIRLNNSNLRMAAISRVNVSGARCQ